MGEITIRQAQGLFEDVIGDVVWGAFDEVGVIVEQLADRLFELERAADQFRWFLDVIHFLLLWRPCPKS